VGEGKENPGKNWCNKSTERNLALPGIYGTEGEAFIGLSKEQMSIFRANTFKYFIRVTKTKPIQVAFCIHTLPHVPLLRVLQFTFRGLLSCVSSATKLDQVKTSSIYYRHYNLSFHTIFPKLPTF
jgi:hypothetical protein